MKINRINAELKAELEQYKDLAEHNGSVCNKRLDKIDELEHNINELNGQLDQLKSENDKFKEEKQGLIKDWEEKKNLAYEIACNNEKLKATLQDIKEIAEKRIPCYLSIGQAKSLTEVEYDYAGKIYYLEQRMYKILQKISECEGNDDMENN